LLGALGFASTPAEAREPASVTIAPLPSSDYSVRPACSQRRQGASCLALELVPLTPAARARRRPL